MLYRVMCHKTMSLVARYTLNFQESQFYPSSPKWSRAASSPTRNERPSRLGFRTQELRLWTLKQEVGNLWARFSDQSGLFKSRDLTITWRSDIVHFKYKLTSSVKVFYVPGE